MPSSAGQSAGPKALPLISVRDLATADPIRRRQVADSIGTAARTFGFFRICDHGIDLALIEGAYDAARRFFSLSDEAKRTYYIGRSTNHRGYVPFTEKGDYPDEVDRSYEAFDLGLDLPGDDCDYLAGNRMLGPNVWPAVPGFRQAITAYYESVARLGKLVCSALELHLGLPGGAMTSQMTKPISQLRLLHYVRKPATTDHQSVNMGAHTDYECLTLLHTRNKGLQVMTQEGDWIDVPADPAVLVVNIGDMMEAWTDGQLRSTPHRVLNLNPERFSMPYFVAANHDAVIAPFPQLVDPARLPAYAPFAAGAHLERMLIRDFPYLRNGRPRGHPAATSNPFENRISHAAP